MIFIWTVVTRCAEGHQEEESPVVRAAVEKYSELFFPAEPDEVTIYLNTEKD